MPYTTRLEKGGGFDHLREALAEVLMKRVEFPRGVLVTVIGAKVTRDTRHVKGVISVFPVDREEDALQALAEARREIKEGLAEKMRLRRIPELHWSCDETEENAHKIEMELNALKTRGEL